MEQLPKSTRRRLGLTPAKIGKRPYAWLSETRRRREWRRNGIWMASGSFVDSSVKIGRFTNIAAPSHIGLCNIGSFVAIAGRLVVRGTNHSTSFANMQVSAQLEVIGSQLPVSGLSRGRISIGHASWIGNSVILVPGANVGTGAVVGAGSVVTSSIPDYAIAVGNPARVLRKRFAEPVCDVLSQAAWWEWSTERIQRNRSSFEIDSTTVDVEELEWIEIRD